MAGCVFSQRQPAWDWKLLFVQRSYENNVGAEISAAVLQNPSEYILEHDILEFYSWVKN